MQPMTQEKTNLYIDFIRNEFKRTLKIIDENKKYLDEKELKYLNILKNIDIDKINDNQLYNLTIRKDKLFIIILDKLLKIN